MFWVALTLIGLVTLGFGYFLYVLWSLLTDDEHYDLYWDDDEF